MSDKEQVKKFEQTIKETLESPDFLTKINDDVLGDVKDETDKKDLVKAALMCGIGGPVGIGKMAITKKFKHIKSRTWKPFCGVVMDLAEKNCVDQFNKLKEISALYKKYKSFWPACDDLLQADIERNNKAMAAQAAMKKGFNPQGGVPLS